MDLRSRVVCDKAEDRLDLAVRVTSQPVLSQARLVARGAGAFHVAARSRRAGATAPTATGPCRSKEQQRVALQRRRLPAKTRRASWRTVSGGEPTW